MDFSQLTADEWRHFDFSDFVCKRARAYLKPYIRYVNAGAIDFDDLVNQFYIEAYPRILRVHEKNLDAPPERRNQLIFGSLRSINNTCFRDAIGSLLPMQRSHIPSDETDLDDLSLIDHILSSEQAAATEVAPQFSAMLHAAPMYDSFSDPERVEQERSADELQLLQMMEAIRSQLTPQQYQLLYRSLFEGDSAQEIADDEGCTRQTIHSRLAYLRKKLAKLAAPAGEDADTATLLAEPELAQSVSQREADTADEMPCGDIEDVTGETGIQLGFDFHAESEQAQDSAIAAPAPRRPVHIPVRPTDHDFRFRVPRLAHVWPHAAAGPLNRLPRSGDVRGSPRCSLLSLRSAARLRGSFVSSSSGAQLSLPGNDMDRGKAASWGSPSISTKKSIRGWTLSRLACSMR